jgi:RNA polymerase sigma-70 factor, ECF subfamily
MATTAISIRRENSARALPPPRPARALRLTRSGDDEARDTAAAFLARLRAGDEAAFEELVRSEGRRLLAAARRILRDEDDAQDAVQDAFVAAFRALPGFEGQACLSTWLYRIAINAALMRLRSRRRRREDPLDPLLPRFESDGSHASSRSAGLPDAEQRLASKQTAARVLACMDRLPESYRVVLVLRDVEGLDTAEAARLLGLKSDALKMRLHRARQALRTLIEADAELAAVAPLRSAAADASIPRAQSA